MRYAPLLALLLAGCMSWPGPHHAARGPELEAVQAAQDAWVAAGRPAPTAETCAILERVEIVYPEDTDSRCANPRAVACVGTGQPYVGAPFRLLIFIRPGQDADTELRLIVHEVSHALRACVLAQLLRQTAEVDEFLWWGVPEEDRPSAPRRPRMNDPQHQDLELWGPIERDATQRLP